MSNHWRCVLELDSQRRITAGSPDALRAAITRGADLRIYSEFFHDEHIDPNSSNHELVQESMDMRVTYVIDGRWCAGVLSLRQPVQLPDQFGPRPSLSLFLYNEDGRQAVARPFLDGLPATGIPGPAPLADHANMPKYAEFSRFDEGTNAPSSNFAYAFERLRYFVREDWRELLHHRADGEILSGSMADLAAAFRAGCEFKVGIRDLCDDLKSSDSPDVPHEGFTQLGSCYFYTETQLFIAGTHPIPRVRPAVPLTYASHGWDYAWLIVRTDGHAALLVYDPYTLRPRRQSGHFEMRWFCR